MILPKKLQPRTEHDILKEVSDELKINIKDVTIRYELKEVFRIRLLSRQ